MHFTALAAAAAVLALCGASPVNSKYVLHEKREQMRRSPAVAKRTRIDTNRVLPVRIGLSQTQMDEAYDLLMDVSHPESKNYGKHWTPEQVNTAFAPSNEAIQEVRDWLISAGIADSRITLSDNLGWLAFEASVEDMEQLVKAQYYEHNYHSDPHKYTVGCDS